MPKCSKRLTTGSMQSYSPIDRKSSRKGEIDPLEFDRLEVEVVVSEEGLAFLI
jgi:hypothetical protein